MADVDMTDAPATASVTKKKGAAAADGESKGEGKKRFEVKKVDTCPLSALSALSALCLD